MAEPAPAEAAVVPAIAEEAPAVPVEAAPVPAVAPTAAAMAPAPAPAPSPALDTTAAVADLVASVTMPNEAPDLSMSAPEDKDLQAASLAARKEAAAKAAEAAATEASLAAQAAVEEPASPIGPPPKPVPAPAPAPAPAPTAPVEVPEVQTVAAAPEPSYFPAPPRAAVQDGSLAYRLANDAEDWIADHGYPPEYEILPELAAEEAEAEPVTLALAPESEPAVAASPAAEIPAAEAAPAALVAATETPAPAPAPESASPSVAAVVAPPAQAWTSIARGFGGFSPVLGTWQSDQVLAVHLEANEYFAKMILPVRQPDGDYRFLIDARSVGSAWVGYGLHFAARPILTHKGYGEGHSWLVWLTSDPVHLGTNQSRLQLYRSETDVQLSMVADVAIPESLFDQNRIEIVVRPAEGLVLILINGNERLRMEGLTGLAGGDYVILRALDKTEFSSFEAQKQE